MFTFSFIALLAVSALALLFSLIWAINRRDLSKIKASHVWLAELVFWTVLSTVLVVGSRLGAIKYALLAFMVVSLWLDVRYYRMVERLRQQDLLSQAPRRRWWPIIDNAAWVLAVLILYFA